jgi:hypothetical protein
LDTPVDETLASPDPFEGLNFDAVDWARLTHAYGSAEAVPLLISLLTSLDDEERSSALDELFASINHQGTVYPASAPAIPFLARAAIVAPGDRALIALLMAGMSRAYGEDWADPTTCSGAVRAQLTAVAAELAPLLADPDADVRRAMLRILAICPPDQVRTIADLRAFDDENEYVRADALMALARVERAWPSLQRRLEESLGDASPAVRQAAALTLLSAGGVPYPQETVAILADSIAAVGDVCAHFGDESWDRLPTVQPSGAPTADQNLGAHALGVLDTLELDPDSALSAAARIVAARTEHAIQGAYLADTIQEHWRDRQTPVAAVLAQFLSTAPTITYPRAHLYRLARCATRIDTPDPALAAAVRPWAAHDDAAVATSALTALARLRDAECLDLADRALAQGIAHSSGVQTVCEVYRADAAVLLPRIRQKLAEALTASQSGRAATELATLVRTLPHIGTKALVAVPDLLDLIKAGKAVRPTLETLTQFGPGALTATNRRGITRVIEAAFRAAESDFDRICAAAALASVVDADALAHRVADELAARPRWETYTVVHLARLGPAAGSCAARIEGDLQSAGAWTAVRAAQTLRHISGETQRSAEVLARHVSEAPVGQAAIAALLEMRHLPEQCVATLHHLAHAPQRLAHDGTQNGAEHADDVLKDQARALLGLRDTPPDFSRTPSPS